MNYKTLMVVLGIGAAGAVGGIAYSQGRGAQGSPRGPVPAPTTTVPKVKAGQVAALRRGDQAAIRLEQRLKMPKHRRLNKRLDALKVDGKRVMKKQAYDQVVALCAPNVCTPQYLDDEFLPAVAARLGDAETLVKIVSRYASGHKLEADKFDISTQGKDKPTILEDTLGYWSKVKQLADAEAVLSRHKKIKKALGLGKWKYNGTDSSSRMHKDNLEATLKHRQDLILALKLGRIARKKFNLSKGQIKDPSQVDAYLVEINNAGWDRYCKAPNRTVMQGDIKGTKSQKAYWARRLSGVTMPDEGGRGTIAWLYCMSTGRGWSSGSGRSASVYRPHRGVSPSPAAVYTGGHGSGHGSGVGSGMGSPSPAAVYTKGQPMIPPMRAGSGTKIQPRVRPRHATKPGMTSGKRPRPTGSGVRVIIRSPADYYRSSQ